MDRETPEAITQGAPIAEADALLSIGPVIVRRDESLHQIAEKAAAVITKNRNATFWRSERRRLRAPRATARRP